MDANGNVLYEVRPESAETVSGALKMANLLVAMRARAAADVSDAAAAASAKIIAAMGCSQRQPETTQEELDKLVQVKGVEKEIVEKYQSWAFEHKLQTVFQSARSQEDVEDGCYKLFKAAKGQVGTGRAAFAAAFYCAGGALRAGDASITKAALVIVKKEMMSFPEGYQVPLATKIKEMEGKLAELSKDEKKDS